jgi:hypothetical protein
MNKSILITTSVLISFLCFISCQEDKNKEIEALLNELYQSKMPDSNLLKNSKIWSSKRINQFDYIQRLTLMDQERISKSNIPTDKPILLEGSVFTSLYDGYTSYAIKDIQMNNDTAKAVVSLKYEQEGIPSENWFDTIILIKNKQWLIEDIKFDKRISSINSLSESLIQFVMYSCQWKIETYEFNKISAMDLSQVNEWLGKKLSFNDSIHFDMRQIPSYASLFSDQKPCKIKGIVPFKMDLFVEGFLRQQIENPKNKNVSFYNINTECETSPIANLIINSKLEVFMMWDGVFFILKPAI